MMQVTAIIPAFNEADRIAETIGALKSIEQIGQIVVVDDASEDNTAECAHGAGADIVLRLKQNGGKGNALAQGVQVAQGEVLCFVDADLGGSAKEFGKLMGPVLADEADMVVAQFPCSLRPGGVGLVKKLASFGINRLSGYRPAAPLSGQRVLKRAVWEQAKYGLDGFGVEVGLTVQCVQNGFRVKEVPVVMTHRETGRDLQGFKHRGRQFIQVSRTLCRLWLRQRVKIG
ncbi:glycosyltransferase family 2 protein [Dethiobacter alkaliphilus]|uniref:glycosyltransferase family 2 protein n=1 Tax=Dethiobacter alkaliphilus TaxID=427926 RepID=UPI0022263477|nr:glycosyltransferase family 2 protein [Dethiobacter alkaliphilus]MCW3490250.1 glycosyltransferase family 2 protein [Dethiobacter alkaliphilus]